MTSAYYLIPTFLAIAISMLVVRAGAVALVMTGMTYEKAKFQALSAFSGTGFTTREAESAINKPQRRLIISWLMILGNAGIVTVIVTATSSFTHAQGLGVAMNVLILLAGGGIVFYIFKHTPLVGVWEQFSRQRLGRLSMFEEELSADELLHLSEGYAIIRIHLRQGDERINKTLPEIMGDYTDVLILGVENSSGWVPTPRMTETLGEGDTLIIYGKSEHLSKWIT